MAKNPLAPSSLTGPDGRSPAQSVMLEQVNRFHFLEASDVPEAITKANAFLEDVADAPGTLNRSALALECRDKLRSEWLLHYVELRQVA